MPIIITVEDGTNVLNANSWVSVEDARLYASNRGIDLPDTENTVEAWLIRAADWLNGKRSKFKGVKTYPAATMQWPRTGVYIDGAAVPLAVTAIPYEIAAAQCQLVIALKAGIDIDGPVVGGVLPVIREKVDVIETEYATPAMMGMGNARWASNQMPAVDDLLAPLLETFSGFRVNRV